MNKVLRIGVAGLGTVGCAVIDVLQKHASCLDKKSQFSLQIVAVSARDKNKFRDVNLENYDWYSDPVEMIKNAKLDIFVELIGGSDSGGR